MSLFLIALLNVATLLHTPPCEHQADEEWIQVIPDSDEMENVTFYYRFDEENMLAIKAVNTGDKDWAFTIEALMYNAEGVAEDNAMGEFFVDPNSETIEREVNLALIDDIEERDFLAAMGMHTWSAREITPSKIELELFNIYRPSEIE
jgi:hypothetical protein